jgi:hypothetical protein
VGASGGSIFQQKKGGVLAKNLKEAIKKNERAAAELDLALRDCLEAMRDRAELAVEGRFRVVEGGRAREHAKM